MLNQPIQGRNNTIMMNTSVTPLIWKIVCMQCKRGTQQGRIADYIDILERHIEV